MEATELMINDWYMNSANEPCKVVKNFGDVVWGKGKDLADSTDEALPIPLTEEILKINGFEDAGGYMTRVDNMKIVEICLISNIPMYVKTEWTYCFPHPQYVHELQHILRLCGLSDLANNFKIQE